MKLYLRVFTANEFDEGPPFATVFDIENLLVEVRRLAAVCKANDLQAAEIYYGIDWHDPEENNRGYCYRMSGDTLHVDSYSGGFTDWLIRSHTTGDTDCSAYGPSVGKLEEMIVGARAVGLDAIYYDIEAEEIEEILEGGA